MIEKEELYPLLFEPIYKEIVWGGNMLKTHLRRTLPKTDGPIAESWELSDRPGDESVISNGALKGKTIRQVIKYYEKAIVGESFSGGRFPLLVKLIDAGKRLSLQVHPGDETARLIPDAEPKTEMWYVIAAKPGAKIFAGLRRTCTQRQFMENLHSTEIENSLQTYESIPGDAYFISAGTVHAIGAGNLLLEIQQNSNSTYRISDWGRIGYDGKPRELHIDNALKCINFMNRTSPRVAGVSDNMAHNRRFPLVKTCPYFKMDELKLIESMLDHTNKSSFHLLTAINNPIMVKSEDGNVSVKVKTGSSTLIPACMGTYSIELCEDSVTTVIKTSI